MQKISIDVRKTKEVYAVLRALHRPLCRKILNYLEMKNGSYVQPIYHNFKIVQSHVSMHLAILRKAGIVQMRKEGRRKFYWIDHQRVKKIVDSMNQYFK